MIDGGRRAIGVADAQVDHVAARGDGGLLLLVDLGEQIRGELPQPFRLHELRRRHRAVSPSISIISVVKTVQSDRSSTTSSAMPARSRRHRFLGNIVVGVDVLNVVVFVEHVPELAHLLAVFDIQVDRRRSGCSWSRRIRWGSRSSSSALAHGFKQLGVAGDLVETFDELDVVGAGIEGRLPSGGPRRRAWDR